jgi:hypothetical protein
MWVPYVLDRMAVRGILQTVTDRGPEGSGPQSVWAKRAIRAHQNAIENRRAVRPGSPDAHELNISTPVTRAAAGRVLWPRACWHFIVDTAGISDGWAGSGAGGDGNGADERGMR